MFLKNKELYKQRRKWPANNGKMGWKKKKGQSSGEVETASKRRKTWSNFS